MRRRGVVSPPRTPWLVLPAAAGVVAAFLWLQAQRRPSAGWSVRELPRTLVGVIQDRHEASTGWMHANLYAVRALASQEGAARGAGAGGAAWSILDTDVQSNDDLVRLWVDAPERVVQVTVHLQTNHAGLVALTRRHEHDEIALNPFNEDALSPADAAAIRVEAVAYVRSLDEPDLVPLRTRLDALARGDRAGSAWSGPGLMVNIALLAGACALGWSVAGAWAWGLDVRGRRRAARGACPGCGYDRRGGGAGACPECGLEGDPTRLMVERREPD